MPKILITGNGFDLNFHLPTRYKDFINILSALEGLKQYDFHSVYSSLSDYNNFWNYYETRVRFDEQKIKELINLTNENLWFKFFKNELEIETWIDFEKKINHVLYTLFLGEKLIEENIFNKGSLREIGNFNSVTLNNEIVLLEILDFFKLISINDDTYKTYDLNPDFVVQKYGFFIKINLKKITDFLYEQLLEFKSIFRSFFYVFILPLYINYKEPFESIKLDNINHHFTFNYTPTFEKYYNDKIKTSYLHGRINSQENNIVLGVNEIPNEFEDKIYFLPFTKYYQKLNNNTDYYFLNEISQSERLNYMFFFFGHSLDKSDEDYINEVFDFISNRKTYVNKIVIIYHNDDAKSKLLLNLLDIRGKEDIVTKMRNKTLIFCKVDSKELIDELNTELPVDSGTIS